MEEYIEEIPEKNEKCEKEKNNGIKRLYIRSCPEYILSATTDLYKNVFESRRSHARIHVTAIKYGLERLDSNNSMKKFTRAKDFLRMTYGNSTDFISWENGIIQYGSIHKGSASGYNISYDEKQSKQLGMYASELRLTYSNILWMAVILGYEVIYENNKEKIPREVIYDMIKREGETITEFINRAAAHALIDCVYVRLHFPENIKVGDKLIATIDVKKMEDEVRIDALTTVQSENQADDSLTTV